MLHAHAAASEQAVAEFDAEMYFEEPIKPIESVFTRMLQPTVVSSSNIFVALFKTNHMHAVTCIRRIGFM
jgi:hypothetical protein